MQNVLKILAEDADAKAAKYKKLAKDMKSAARLFRQACELSVVATQEFNKSFRTAAQSESLPRSPEV